MEKLTSYMSSPEATPLTFLVNAIRVLVTSVIGFLIFYFLVIYLFGSDCSVYKQYFYDGFIIFAVCQIIQGFGDKESPFNGAFQLIGSGGIAVYCTYANWLFWPTCEHIPEGGHKLLSIFMFLSGVIGPLMLLVVCLAALAFAFTAVISIEPPVDDETDPIKVYNRNQSILMKKMRVRKIATHMGKVHSFGNTINKKVDVSQICCPICAKSYMPGDSLMILACNAQHYFHENCAMKKSSCPICKETINESAAGKQQFVNDLQLYCQNCNSYLLQTQT